MKAFLAWATLPNVARVVDLTLKLAAVVAVLTVSAFFTGRGDLSTLADCWAPVASDLDEVIATNLGLSPKEALVPEAALRASEQQPALPLSLAAGDSMRIGCSRDIRAVEDLKSRNSFRFASSDLQVNVPLGQLSPKERRERMAFLIDIYPDSSGGFNIVHYVPEVAVLVAASPDLSTNQVRRVIETIELSRAIEIFVKVTNVGKADALDVHIPAPENFTLLDGHPLDFEMAPEYKHLAEPGIQPVVYEDDPSEDLEAGEAVYFIFETKRYTSVRPEVELGDLVPEADTTPAVNVDRQFLVLALLVILIVLPLVVREIRSAGEEAPGTSTQ